MKYSKLKLTKYVIITLVSLIMNTAVAQSVEVWLTTGDQANKLSKKNDLSFSSATNNGTVIDIDNTISYQTMDGFGAAMTGSSAYLIQTKLSSSQKDAFLNDLFTNSGINLSMVRHSIGASDFNLSSYTYNDIPQGQTDPSLNNFSLGNDLMYLVPSLLASITKKPSLKIMGSPWSAPAWMKENYTLNGSWLDTQWYKSYADYLVKYVQEYQNLGLPIWAISLQNEPKYETSSYPSMRMDPGNQIAFIKNDIGPAFENAGLNTGIIAYDHNWDDPNYPIEVLNDSQAKSFTIGSGFHGYAGNVSAQSTVHNAHPDKGIWFTEITGGDYAPNFGNNLAWNMKNIIVGTTRNWAKGILLWNLALDENSGPQNGGCSDCRGVVTINSTSGAVTKEVEYYVLGHISKFVNTGAQRIFSTNSNKIYNVAFKNTDGSIAIIAYNDSNKPQETVTIRVDNKSFNYSIPKNSAVTFKWNPSNQQNNVAPIVALNTPQNQDIFTAPADINISANASDTDGTITAVEFYANGTLLGSDQSSPYTFNWLGVNEGNYDIYARAIDNEGATTDSEIITISINGNGNLDSMSVSSVNTSTQSASRGRKFGTASVFIIDNLGNPVENATVNGQFMGSFSETVSGITDVLGRVDFITTNSLKGSLLVDFCISNVNHPILTYNSDPQWVCSNSNRLLSKNTNDFNEDISLIYNNKSRKLLIKNNHKNNSLSSVEIYNIYGRSIKKASIKNSNTIYIDLSTTKKGMYVVKINNSGSPIIKKIIVY